MPNPIKRVSLIVHLIDTCFYGGPEKQIVEHLKRLNKDYYKSILASFLEGRVQNEVLQQAELVGLQHYGIRMFGKLDFTALMKLVKILRKEKVDLLCAHGYKSTVMGWWAGRKIGIPVIAFSRGYTTENIKVAFYEWIERRVLRSLNGIIYVSEGQKRRLNVFGVHNTRSWVVHNAVSINNNLNRSDINLRKRVIERLGLSDNSTIIVSAGRLSPEKGHRFLIEAISKLSNKANGAYFVFCGDGICKKELESQAQKLKVADRCRFVGFRRDLDEIYRVMDFMVLSSLTEGLPNVLLEAFSYAKPSVATAVGGVPEVVDNGVNGILVPPRRPDLLAKAIETFLAEPRILRKMGEAGYKKVKSDFTFELQTQKLEKIYHQVLTENK